MMDGYRDRESDDPDMIRVLGKLRWQTPRTLAFLEHPSVDPSNNVGERAPRYMMAFRTMIWQAKGGPRAMRRLTYFVTCVFKWRKQDKIVYEEAARLYGNHVNPYYAAP